MKIWKCPECNIEKLSEDKIIFKTCYVCQVEMIEAKENENKI